MTLDLYYLSFADPKRPKGQQWLGCCYVEAESVHHAILHVSREHDCNPGGEVMVIKLPPEAKARLKPEALNKLLDEEGLRSAPIEEDRVLVRRDGTIIPDKGR